MKRIALVSLVVSLEIASVGQVLAMTEQEATSRVRTATNIGEAYRKAAVVRVAGNIVSVQLYKDARAADNDMKIDSILLAKTLMEADPAGVHSVRVYFYDSQRSYYIVEVGKTDISAFTAAGVSRDEMLSSISMRHEGVVASLDELLKEGVPGGPALELRSNLVARLKFLHNRYKVNLNEYAARMAQINRQAATNQKVTERQIEDQVVALSAAIDEYVHRYNAHADIVNAKAAAKNKANAQTPVLTEVHAAGSTTISPDTYREMKARYPFFIAVKGHSYNARLAIGVRLMQMADRGADVYPYKPLFAKMNVLAGKDDKQSENELDRLVELMIRRTRVAKPQTQKQ